VVFDLEVEFGHLADVLEDHEVLLAAGRGAFDDVGDGVLQLLQLLLRRRLLRFGLLDAGLELVGALQQRRTVLGGGLADLLAKRLLLGAQLVRLLDGGAAGLVGVQQLVHKRRVFAAGSLGLADGLGVFAHTLQINHACSPYIVCRPCNRRSNGTTVSGHNQWAMVGV